MSDLTLDDAPQLLRASDARTSEVVVDVRRASRHGIGRRWRVGVAVLGAIVLVAATVLVTRTVEDASEQHATTASSTPIQTPPPPAPTTVASNVVTPPITAPGDGSKEDPLVPQGEPSTPQTGELVASVAAMDGRVYSVYTDGRLIGPSMSRPGLVEQRLTAEGVERVRSEFLKTGLFGPGQPAIAVYSPSQVLSCVCVRDNGRLLARSPQRDVDVEAAAAGLIDYFEMLGSSLPPTEWVDQQERPYIASTTAVCLRMFVHFVEEPPDLAALLPLFPPRAAELLGGRRTIDDPDRQHASCFEMTLEEARELADAFLAPTGGALHEYWGIVIGISSQFDAMTPGSHDENAAYISFRPMLPHGEPAPR